MKKSGKSKHKRPRIVVTTETTPGVSVVRSTPRSSGVSGNNFYIFPKEVFDFLTNNPEFYEGTKLNLRKLNEWFKNLDSKPDSFIPFWLSDRSDPNFLINEYYKLFASSQDVNKPGWMFPYITDNFSLSIPMKDVFDLPLFIMLFILRKLTQFPDGKSSFTVSYNLESDVSDNNTFYPVYNEDDYPISVVHGLIEEEDLEQLYITLIKKFASLLPEGDATWNGSEESGTRIILQQYLGGRNMYLKLKLIPIRTVNYGHGWTQQVEVLLKKTVKSSVMSVRNKDDNKCLIYCIVLGLITKIKGGKYDRIFGHSRGINMIDPVEIFAKGTCLFPDTDQDEVTKCIKRLCGLLIPTGSTSIDPLYQIVEDIDKKAGTMISVSDFRKEFSEIEKQLIPASVCGIDVYGIDFNINSHIYPLYMSKNREKIIELLCVTPLDTKCSHYCLIVNKEHLFKNAGGKQFFSCSKCGECFYHRRLLTDHNCPFQMNRNNLLPAEGGYHFSRKTIDPNSSQVVGLCSKCRLCFTDEFSFNYHKDHCFMSNQTGYRHVQLVTYKEDEHPTLNGTVLNMEEENKHINTRRIMYADFECAINPETGEHSFMSYGIYDCDDNDYQCGYDLQEFIDFIMEKAYSTKEKNQIYVYFHNAMGYDANFVLRHILKNPDYVKWGIQVIMKSMNKLQKLVFHAKQEGEESVRTIHIGDTFLFLTLSLDRIVNSIRKDDIEINQENFSNFFEIFHERYPDVSDEMIDHILRKNIFPYKFFTDPSKLDTPKEQFLAIFEPKQENLQYFSERVTLDDLVKSYADTKNVIEVFNCEDARDYHDLYLCCDVMQLADVFNRSMDILWESHHIHLTKYIGMPSASWAAFLRHDPTMCIPLYEDTFYAEFFKGMIRGGITSAALRYAQADDTHSIIYLDVNGLYPYVMQAYKFPCGRFQHINLNWETKEICHKNLYDLFENFEKTSSGMCFCVDMIIPDEVKYLTDMYPFAPEHRRIFKEYYTENADGDTKELTPFLKRWSEANTDGNKMTEFTGLVCTLYNKEKYNVHWRLLKFYIEHGVIITKVHFAVSFTEGDYLAGYIRKNISIRNTRRDELGKTLYKLLGNSIYGKTFESPFKRNTFEIVRDPVKLQGLLEEGNIAAVTPIDDCGWIVRMDGENIILDKPTYIGACVCEFAKLHMYSLLYDKLFKIFPEGCQMVYTDTDSFIVRVQHPSDFPINKPQDLFSYIRNKDPDLIGGIGGQVKSETGEDDTIKEVIALRSKVYAYKTLSGHIGKRAKGTTYDAQEMQLDWELYKQTLESLVSVNTRNIQFVRKTFKISSLDVFRQSLSVNDGKRYICEDGIRTHAFGYPGI